MHISWRWGTKLFNKSSNPLKCAWAIVLFIALAIAPCASYAATVSYDDWQRYKQSFISPEGRVIDTGNHQISHSEGQGYGMLLALGMGDRTVFESIWNWTRANLQREDGLFGWQWNPNTSPHVQDWNNATDGDLLIAWSLMRAGQYWNKSEWTQEGKRIALRIRETLVRPSALGPLILPAQQGFEQDGYVQVNPSYWVYPAFKTLKEIDPDPVWLELIDSGLRLIEMTRYGPYSTPPDWIRVYADGHLGLPSAPTHRRFGFQAIRIPLYLCWAGLNDSILLSAFMKAWPNDQVPAWIDLANGDRAAYPLTLAQKVIRRLVLNCSGKNTPMVSSIETSDYYGSTLLLLSQLARSKSIP